MSTYLKNLTDETVRTCIIPILTDIPIHSTDIPHAAICPYSTSSRIETFLLFRVYIHRPIFLDINRFNGKWLGKEDVDNKIEILN
jgi:hypothetical protein